MENVNMSCRMCGQRSLRIQFFFLHEHIISFHLTLFFVLFLLSQMDSDIFSLLFLCESISFIKHLFTQYAIQNEIHIEQQQLLSCRVCLKCVHRNSFIVNPRTQFNIVHFFLCFFSLSLYNFYFCFHFYSCFRTICWPLFLWYFSFISIDNFFLLNLLFRIYN